MNHLFGGVIFLIVLPTLSSISLYNDVKIPDYILVKHRGSIKAWLSNHPQYRLAVETDCLYCSESIAMMRTEAVGDWKPLPKYQPYYTVGDFNSDNVVDFAVAVIDINKTRHKFRILVFNGPFSDRDLKTPAFISEPMDLSNEGMFYGGGPRPKPWRLLVGPFESEGAFLLPAGKSYRWEGPSTE